MQQETYLKLAQEIAKRFGSLPSVEFVMLGGSQSTEMFDDLSDIDLYVYSGRGITIRERKKIVSINSRDVELNNQFWETGDEWYDTPTGIHVDVMYRSAQDALRIIDRLNVQYQASVGYSTALWFNLLHSRVLYVADKSKPILEVLQKSANEAYPEQLKRAIIAKNYPLLRQSSSSYWYQLRSAVARGDLVSVNHRVAALLASYFDVIFALNKQLHPGEKRLLTLTEQLCPIRPANMRTDVETLLHAAGQGGDAVLTAVNRLADGLDAIMRQQGF